MRLLLAFAAALLVSCEPAPLAVPPVDDTPDGWEVQDDWPKLPQDRKLGRVLGIALDAKGSVWISHTGVDGGPPEILALDPVSGEVVGSIDARGFATPHALIWDEDGHLWVTDDGKNRVVVMDASGRVLRTIGSE